MPVVRPVRARQNLPGSFYSLLDSHPQGHVETGCVACRTSPHVLFPPTLHRHLHPSRPAKDPCPDDKYTSCLQERVGRVARNDIHDLRCNDDDHSGHHYRRQQHSDMCCHESSSSFARKHQLSQARRRISFPNFRNYSDRPILPIHCSPPARPERGHDRRQSRHLLTREERYGHELGPDSVRVERGPILPRAG